jgi:hypothetical protein
MDSLPTSGLCSTFIHLPASKRRKFRRGRSEKENGTQKNGGTPPLTPSLVGLRVEYALILQGLMVPWALSGGRKRICGGGLLGEEIVNGQIVRPRRGRKCNLHLSGIAHGRWWFLCLYVD